METAYAYYVSAGKRNVKLNQRGHEGSAREQYGPFVAKDGRAITVYAISETWCGVILSAWRERTGN